MNKKFRCLLVSLIFTAMWNGTTIQAQAPHPERIYLSGTGIDNTKTWNYRDSENIHTVDGIP